jgi:hypothetical protein
MDMSKDGLVIDSDGIKHWYKDGKYHREDGPAIEDRNGNEWWLKNGSYHRIGGPAVEYHTGRKEYWLYGKRYKESDYNKWMSNLPLLYWKRFKGGKWI